MKTSSDQKRYQSKKPCKKCSSYERFRSNRNCVHCKKISQRTSIIPARHHEPNLNGKYDYVLPQLVNNYIAHQFMLGWTVQNSVKRHLLDLDISRCPDCGAKWVMDKIHTDNLWFYSYCEKLKPCGRNIRWNCPECGQYRQKTLVRLIDCMDENAHCAVDGRKTPYCSIL